MTHVTGKAIFFYMVFMGKSNRLQWLCINYIVRRFISISNPLSSANREGDTYSRNK